MTKRVKLKPNKSLPQIIIKHLYNLFTKPLKNHLKGWRPASLKCGCKYHPLHCVHIEKYNNSCFSIQLLVSVSYPQHKINYPQQDVDVCMKVQRLLF